MRKHQKKKRKRREKKKEARGGGNLPSLRVSITNHLREMSVSLSLIRDLHRKSG